MINNTILPMNYKKIYDSLIFKRKFLEPVIEGYKELHHIIPRCMGGSESEDNLVFLTAREHYVAHRLLWSHYRLPSLAHAWFSMVRKDPNQQRVISAREYEAARQAHSEVLKITMKGSGNNFYGKKHSEDSKRKIGEKNSGRVKSKEEIENWIAKVSSKPKSPEHRAKIGRKGFIMLKNITTGESIRIKKEDKHMYDSSIWKNPFSCTTSPVLTCPRCGKVGKGKANMTRWHFENCSYENNSN